MTDMLWAFLLMVASWVADTPVEDDPNWNCHIHGNRICGER